MHNSLFQILSNMLKISSLPLISIILPGETARSFYWQYKRHSFFFFPFVSLAFPFSFKWMFGWTLFRPSYKGNARKLEDIQFGVRVRFLTSALQFVYITCTSHLVTFGGWRHQWFDTQGVWVEKVVYLINCYFKSRFLYEVSQFVMHSNLSLCSRVPLSCHQLF